MMFFLLLQRGEQGPQTDFDRAQVGDFVNFDLRVNLAVFLKNLPHFVSCDRVDAAAEGCLLYTSRCV